MRPPFPYFGAKQNVAAEVLRVLDTPHAHYVEPCAGSLSVLVAKSPVAHETANDIDGDLVNFWRQLRDHGEELSRLCALTPHSRREYQLALERSEDPLEQARRTWVRLTQSIGGSLRAGSGWRHYQKPSGRGGHGMGHILASYVDRMGPVIERLSAVSLECRPALEVIADYGRHDGVLMYLDPPYLGATRSAGATNYRHEMWGKDAHRELLEAARAAACKVAISGYECDLYDEMLAGWHRHRFTAFAGNGHQNRARVEIIWTNYSPSMTLF